MVVPLKSSREDIVSYINSGYKGSFLEYYLKILHPTYDYSDTTNLRIVIENEDFSTVNFPKSFELSQVIFKNCQFNNVNFSLAKFTDVEFIEAKLYGTNFSKSILTRTNFNSCTSWASNPVNFASAKMEYVEINKSTFPCAIFSESNTQNLSITESDIREIRFDNLAHIQDLKIENCPSVERADFSRAWIKGFKLCNSNVQEADFSGIVTHDDHNVEFSNLKQSESLNFEGSVLKNTKFNDVTLNYSDFSSAKIVSVDIVNSRLHYANFNDAELDKISCDDVSSCKGISFRKAKGAALSQFKEKTTSKEDSPFNRSYFGICKTDENGVNKRFELQKIGFKILRYGSITKFTLGENSYFNLGLGTIFLGIVPFIETYDITMEKFVDPKLGYINNVVGDTLALIGALLPPLVTSQVFGSVGILFLSLLSTTFASPIPAADFTIAGSALAQFANAGLAVSNEYQLLSTKNAHGIYDNAPEDNYDRNEELFKNFKQNISRYSALSTFVSSHFNVAAGLICIASLAVLASAAMTAPIVALVPIAAVFFTATAIYCGISIYKSVKDINSVIENQVDVNKYVVGEVTDQRKLKKERATDHINLDDSLISGLYNKFIKQEYNTRLGIPKKSIVDIALSPKKGSWVETMMSAVGLPTGRTV